MRIGLFGDVHGNLEALDAVLAALKDAQCEKLLCTGDLVNYGPDPAAVAERVLKTAAACVAGNHDIALATGAGAALFGRPGRDEDLERACFAYTLDRLSPSLCLRLAALPRIALWPPGGPRVLLAHGSPDDPEEYVTASVPRARRHELAAQAGTAWLCLGHTHLPMCLGEGGTAICNPGSVGWPKDGDWRASCALIDVERPPGFRLLRVPYDIERTAAKLRRAGLPDGVARAMMTGRPRG